MSMKRRGDGYGRRFSDGRVKLRRELGAARLEGQALDLMRLSMERSDGASSVSFLEGKIASNDTENAVLEVAGSW